MAIKTWTYYDVTKLNLAIQNKLNYLVNNLSKQNRVCYNKKRKGVPQNADIG